MKFNLNYLRSFFLDDFDLNDLSEKLFQLGHEHEIVNEIIDIDFTPNRGDCLSVIGILRDLSAFYAIDLKTEVFEESIEKLDYKFESDAIEACTQISFLLIEISDVVKNYNGELNDFFSSNLNKKNNFFTDVSNFISYELGQPTHCYDFLAISKGLKLQFLEKNENFENLFGDEMSLSKGDLVFKNSDGIIENLAGIVGGKRSACKRNTLKVLVECANFNPEFILGKSVKYNIQSDASYKFERQVDPEIQDHTLRRFIKIVSDHAEITDLKRFTKIYDERTKKVIEFNNFEINKILGSEIEATKSTKILEDLGFDVSEDCVEVPSYRSDIANVNDLAEEIARVTGYNNLPSQHLDLKKISSQKSHERKLRDFMVDNGFTEVINSQFSPNKYDHSVSVDNPLDETRAFLRVNIRESLLSNIEFNEKRQKDSIKLFEISDVYSLKKNDIGFNKEKLICIVASGSIGKNYKEFHQKISKNYLNELFPDIDIEKYFIKVDRDNIDSKMKTEIICLEAPIEIFNIFFDTYLFEENFKTFKYKNISEFPSSKRDFSFLLNDESMVDEISKIIQEHEFKNMKECFLFDYYKNEKRKEIKIAFRFIFQGIDKTLTEDEINIEIQSLLEKIFKLDNVSIPGYKINES